MKNVTPLLSCCLVLLTATTGRAQASLNPSLPSNVTICTGSNASFTVSATGSGTLSYQWQESTDGGISWNNLLEGTTTSTNPSTGIYTGTTSPVLTITRAPSTMGGHKYRSNVYVNGANGVSSIPATLTVGPVINLDDVNQVNCPAANSTVGTVGATGATFQWQVSSNNGGSWSNIVNGPDPSGVTYSGGTNSALTITALTTAVDGYQYREIANDGAGCVVTGGVTTQRVPTLAVFSLPAAGTVSAAVGQSASIPATVTAGTGPFTYQWQVAVGAGGFTNITAGNAAYTGQMTSTLNIPSVTTAIYANRYRVLVKNSGGCTASSTSFAQIGVAVSLPLAITGFVAERQGASTVKLSWTAETPAATAAFTVQRAGKGSDFIDVANIPDDSGKTDHAFLDQGGGSGALRYRIRVSDRAGATAYSVVAEVAGDGSNDVLELRPSVITGANLSLYTTLTSGEPLLLTITDVTGRVLWSATVRPGKGASSTLLDVPRLGKGIYYLHASSAAGITRTMPFVKE